MDSAFTIRRGETHHWNFELSAGDVSTGLPIGTGNSPRMDSLPEACVSHQDFDWLADVPAAGTQTLRSLVGQEVMLQYHNWNVLEANPSQESANQERAD